MSRPTPSTLEQRPLLGMVIGITADRRWEEQAELLRRRGARVIHGPTVRTHALGPGPELAEAIDALIAREPDVVVLTTAIGLRGLLESAEALGRADALRALFSRAELVARGPKAAGLAAGEGWQLSWQAPDATSAELVEHLAQRGVHGKRVATVLDGRRHPVLAEQVAALGAEVVPIPVYRWELPEDHAPAHRLIDMVTAGEVDVVTFTSSPGVLNMFDLADEIGRRDELIDVLGSLVEVVSVGPVCSATLRSRSIRVEVEPRRPRLGAMVHALSTRAAHTRRPTTLGAVELLLDGTDAVVDGQVLALTGRERAVLSMLGARPGVVVSKAELRDVVWGDDTGLHAVEVTVGRLRERLSDALADRLGILAVPRRGYRLVAD